jgi:hypothetical protein
MGKKTDFSVDYAFVGLLCLVCIPLGYQHFLINPKIQSRTPQQQASVQRSQKNINSAFDGLEKRLEPLVECIVDGGVKSNQQHDKTCKGSMAILSLLNAISRQQ